MPASQAGRRGFDSRLPLHPVNNLEKLTTERTPIYSIYMTRKADSSNVSKACLRRPRAVFVNFQVHVNGVTELVDKLGINLELAHSDARACSSSPGNSRIRGQLTPRAQTRIATLPC